MDNVAIRKLFPGLQDKVFLDAACVSLVPVIAKESINDFLNMSIQCNARDASLHHIEMDMMRLKPLAEAAQLLNVNVSNLCLIESTTHGLNIAANAIALNNGDNILIADTEFLQVSIPWIQKQKKVNFEIRQVETRDNKLPLEEFTKLIDKKTKIICVSSVQWCTGHRVDIETLAKLCKTHDIWLVVDGIHELGAMTTDLSKRHADFYISGGHKWLNSPFGCGIMYLSNKVLSQLEPNSYGYLSTEEPEGGWGQYFRTPEITPFRKFNFVQSAKKFEIGGTSNYPGAVGLGTSLALVNQIGIRNIDTRIRKLSSFLHEELNDLNVHKVTQEDSNLRSGLTIFSYFNDPQKDLKLVQYLLNKRIYVSLRYTSRIGGIRVSTHYYNNEDDVLRLVEEVKNYAKQQ